MKQARYKLISQLLNKNSTIKKEVELKNSLAVQSLGSLKMFPGVTVNLDTENSKKEKLIFKMLVKHYDENGYYIKTTAHNVIITPSLVSDYNVKVTNLSQLAPNQSVWIFDILYYWLSDPIEIKKFENGNVIYIAKQAPFSPIKKGGKTQ